MHGFVGNDDVEFDDLDHELSHPTDLRVFAIAQALEKGYTIDRIFELTKIDPWFLGKLKNIVDYKNNSHNMIKWKTFRPMCCAKRKCSVSPTSRLRASC